VGGGKLRVVKKSEKRAGAESAPHRPILPGFVFLAGERKGPPEVHGALERAVVGSGRGAAVRRCVRERRKAPTCERSEHAWAYPPGLARTLSRTAARCARQLPFPC
jgi:hypothetical protein